MNFMNDRCDEEQTNIAGRVSIVSTAVAIARAAYVK
jgi:hypothetical protein